MAEFNSGFIVVMENDIGEEDSKSVIDALRMIKGVTDVQPIGKEPTDKRLERSRLKGELRKTINQFLDGV